MDRTRRNRLAAVLAAVVIGAVGAFMLAPRSTPQGSTEGAYAAPASIADGASRVGALGRIEPHSQVIQIGGPSDEQLGALLVSEGDEVTKGQVLGHLRSYPVLAAERDRTAARLAEAEQLRAAATEAGEAAIREAELKLRMIEEAYPLRIRAQEARIRRLEAELANNEDILKTRGALLAQQTQTRREFENQQTLVIQNREELRSQRHELERLNKEMGLERQSAQAALQRIRADLLRSQITIGVESLRRELEVATAKAAGATLIAPIDGRILKITVRPGERLGSTPILTMGDTREMHAVAEVYESDVKRVRRGQRAVVTSPALPQPMTGEVVDIGRMIFKNDVLGIDPAARVDARVVEVRIRLDDSALAANFTHLTVDVVIETGPATSVASGR